MLTLLALVLVAEPAWVDDAKLKPPAKAMLFTGDGAPADAVILPPKKKETLTVTGPAKLVLTLIGIVDKKSVKAGAAGAVDVKLDKNGPQRIAFPATAATFGVDKKPKLAALVPQVLELTLIAGSHTVTLTPAPAAGKIGYALIVTINRGGTPGPVAAVTPPPAGVTPPPDQPPPPVEPPPQPPPPTTPPPAAGGGGEPTLAGGDAEPDITAGPTNVPEPAPLGTEGYTFVGNPPPLTTLTGSKGTEKLLKISINEGLELAAIGPGRMVFDIHAHRNPATPDSMKPVIVGVMIDDVLIQTLSVDQPTSPDLKAEGETYTPSVRVTLRVPVEPGSHRVRITLSDSAVLGASIRPRFEPLSGTEEPSVVSAEMARSGDLTAAPPMVEVYGSAGVALMAAAWAPSAFPRAGGMAELDVNLQIPVAGPRLAAGLWAGYGRVDYNRNYPDDRRASGVSRSRLELTTVPVLVEARWSAPIPAPFGVEAGIGGGVILASATTRSAGGANNPGLKVLGAGVVQATGLYELGPGVLLLKVQLVTSQPMKTDAVKSFDAGGAMASLGYRFTFGKSHTP